MPHVEKADDSLKIRIPSSLMARLEQEAQRRAPEGERGSVSALVREVLRKRFRASVSPRPRPR